MPLSLLTAARVVVGLHIIDVEYLDDWRYPEAERLLWEVEATGTVLGTTSLPSVDANRPDSPQALQAFVNAHRWTRLNRLRESDDIKDEPLLGVWNSAIQVHAYQLEPVLKALAMPRVSLLLADGVGLGKTIQAGLVLEELLLRRRIRRILVVCPAMLQRQWQYQLRRKFNLDFRVFDSDSTFKLRRNSASTRTRGKPSPASSRRWTTCECPMSSSSSYRRPVRCRCRDQRQPHDGSRSVGSAYCGRSSSLRPSERKPCQPTDSNAAGDQVPV